MMLSTSIFAQNGQKSIDEALNSMRDLDYTYYFEVSNEMFKMMSEAEGVDAQYKAYLSKLSSLKMVRAKNTTDKEKELYGIFMAEVNLKDYSMLMTSTEPNRKISFYKRTKNAVNQFLLVSNTNIIYITGTIDIKSLQEFENVMNIAGRTVGF